MTLDYGLRVTHHGAIYEVQRHEFGLRPQICGIAHRPRRSTSRTARPASPAISRAPRPTGGRVTRSPAKSCRRPTRAPRCRAPAASPTACSPAACPARNPAGTTTCPFSRWGPRIGVAWDVTGDGKTAIRAAGGIFYNFINRSQYLYDGGPLIAQDKVVRNATHRRCDGLRAGGHAVRRKPADGQLAG